MNKWYKPYLYLIIVTGWAIFIQALLFLPIPKSIDWFLVVALILMVIAETTAIEYSRGLAISLHGPLISLITLLKPMNSVLITIFVFSVLSSLIYKLSHKDESFINVKLFYNTAALFITAFVLSQFVQFISYDHSVLFLLKLAAFAATGCLLNWFFPHMILGLIQNQNLLRDVQMKELMNSIFFYCIIVILYYMLKRAYGIPGVVLFSLFLIPSYASIINSLSGLQINKKLHQDNLTNLLNRRYLEESIFGKLKLKQAFTLLFLDLNKFKAINDTYGHLAGDAVLLSFAGEFKRHLRKEDKAFRYGGDEFCILFTSQEDAANYKKRMETLGNSYTCTYNDIEIIYSFSFGSLFYDGQSELSFEDIISNADKKMYLNKKVAATL